MFNCACRDESQCPAQSHPSLCSPHHTQTFLFPPSVVFPTIVSNIFFFLNVGWFVFHLYTGLYNSHRQKGRRRLKLSLGKETYLINTSIRLHTNGSARVQQTLFG